MTKRNVIGVLVSQDGEALTAVHLSTSNNRHKWTCNSRTYSRSGLVDVLHFRRTLREMLNLLSRLYPDARRELIYGDLATARLTA